MKEIQKQLVKMEIIPQSALTAVDSYPLSDDKIAAAVATAKDGKGMAVVLTHPAKALPLLKQAYEQAANDKDKLAYAKILAVMGDAAGLDRLIAALDAATWDKGWNYTGMGQFGSSLSTTDRLIVAIGRTRDKRGLPPIFKKLALLDATSEFSHHRAVALALETIGDPSAADPLAELLGKPKMRGYATTNVTEAAQRTGNNPNDNTTRATSIRELSLARAYTAAATRTAWARRFSPNTPPTSAATGRGTRRRCWRKRGNDRGSLA